MKKQGLYIRLVRIKRAVQSKKMSDSQIRGFGLSLDLLLEALK